jgi:hypothetical protein
MRRITRKRRNAYRQLQSGHPRNKTRRMLFPVCPNCGHNFVTSNRKQIFCGHPCRNEYHNARRKSNV